MSLGGVALGLVVGVLALGIAALFVDGGAVAGDPFDTSSWPVHPLVIVVAMGIGLLVGLVLAERAVATRRGRGFGAAAICVGLVPAVAIALGLSAVVVNAIT